MTRTLYSLKIRKCRFSAILAMSLFSACSGNFHEIEGSQSSAPTSTAVLSAEETVSNLSSARMSFHFSDYYSLALPRSDRSCAGDILNYYDAFEIDSTLGSPLKFPESKIDSTTRSHPDFIKNISVDITNSNASSPLNAAYTCSLGSGPSIPTASSCATFDYGAIGGLPTHFGGSVLLVGGLHDVNYSGIQNTLEYHGPSVSCGPQNPVTSSSTTQYSNACDAQIYALGIHTLPASIATDPPHPLAPGVTSATEPLSTWANLKTSTEDPGPNGLVGSALSYNLGLQRLISYSGTAPLSHSSSTGVSAPQNKQWIFNVKNQTWSSSDASSAVENDLQTMLDYDSGTSQLNQWPKPSGARFSFGYTPAQGFALSGMSNNTTVSNSQIDRTDRILIVGGYGSYGYDTRKFNPTYGPEWNDTAGSSTEPNQWLDSYHTQALFNHIASSGYFPALGGTGAKSVSFSIASARNNSIGQVGAGYLYALGGFKTTGTKNTTTATGGALNLFWRGSTASESSTSNYSAVPNFLDGTQTSTQGQWIDVMATSGSAEPSPWYGGGHLIPGFNLRQNEFIFFGGTDCPNYLSSSSSGCSFNASSIYWSFGTQPATGAGPTGPTSSIPAGTAPAYAGMAAARGVDPGGKVIVIAIGGAASGGATSNANLYYLYNQSGTPTWVSTATSNTPPGVADGTLVFSHVTRKFYLYGGYSSTTASVNADLWELSIGPSHTSCTTLGTCTFIWKKITDGLTCYPECPSSRRSHRMVEVNYYHRNPGGLDPDGLGYGTDGESTCTDPSKPCSYGIFMEGGTHDGTNPLGDRWMFDPTANGGAGHWQKMGELPPRNFASMSAVDYYLPLQNKIVHRAVLFGGETGMANPQMASNVQGSTTYFVPPTLGDTWMYDFDQNTWNRVKLLGKGWKDATFPMTFSTELEARESYRYDSGAALPNEAVLSPPPLSGAVMITRTSRNSTHKEGDPSTPLAIPEIYLFGGRTKDGSFLPLNQVYKFCAGSTGEKPFLGTGTSQMGTLILGEDDASCDAYDATTNPYSPSPSQEFQGRWILKTPAGVGMTSSGASSFLGKAVYDPFTDRIILVGGLSGTHLPGAVTDSSNLAASITIDEYTPPSSTTGSTATTQGYWTRVSTCSGSSTPTGRYGHSLSYDLLNHQLILVGGYDVSGIPLVQQMTYYDGRTYALPDIWVAKRSHTLDCYTWTQISQFSNSIDIAAQRPPMSGLTHASSLYIPADGYNTGFYTFLDPHCTGAGPIGMNDPSVNKLMAGGVYIDLDRSKLKERENLLLHIKYIPLGVQNRYSDNTPLRASDSAIFKIHLVKAGLSLSEIRASLQPRYLLFGDPYKYPEIAKTISILAPPSSGQIQEEQVFLPISSDPLIDRIRIERYSGSGILIDASLYRLGGGNP